MSTVKLNDKVLRETMKALYSDLLKDPGNKVKFDEFCQIYETHKTRNSFFKNLVLDSDSDLYFKVAKTHPLLAKFMFVNKISSENVNKYFQLRYILDLPKDDFLSEEILAILKAHLKFIKGLNQEIALFRDKVLNEIYPDLTDDEKVEKLLDIIGDDILYLLVEFSEELLLDPRMHQIIINKLQRDELQITEKLLSLCIYNSSFNGLYNSVINIAVAKQMLGSFSNVVSVAKYRPDLFLLCNYKKLSVSDWLDVIKYYDGELCRNRISEEYLANAKIVISCFNLYWLKAVPEECSIVRLIGHELISYNDILAAQEPQEIDILNYNLKSLTMLEVFVIAKQNIADIRLKLNNQIILKIKDNDEIVLSCGNFDGYDADLSNIAWKSYFFNNYEDFSQNHEFTLSILSTVSSRTFLQFLSAGNLSHDCKCLMLKLINDGKLGRYC